MKTHLTLLTLAVCSLSAFAADVTGTWKAEFETQRGLQKYIFTLKQDGTSVTGKASVERDGGKREAELKEGKVEGDTVTFVEPLKIQDNEINITYTGKITADEIKFTRKVGDFGSSEATAKRGGAPPKADAPAGQEAARGSDDSHLQAGPPVTGATRMQLEWKINRLDEHLTQRAPEATLKTVLIFIGAAAIFGLILEHLQRAS